MSSNKTHTAIALIDNKRTLGAINVPTRSPSANEVLVKIAYASFAAFDGHVVDDNFYVQSYPQLLGIGAAGTIIEVGSGVQDLKVGDTAGIFSAPNGAMQEYVTIDRYSVAPLPADTKKEDVAALMDNFVTAWWTVTNSLGLTVPSPGSERLDEATASTPILIYGAGTSAGQYVLQVLKYAGYTNVIATASPRTAALATTSGATKVIDYNDPELSAKLKAAARSRPIKYALDPICTIDSLSKISKVVDTAGSKVAILVPVKIGELKTVSEGGATLSPSIPDDLNPFTSGVEVVPVLTFYYGQNEALKLVLLNKILPSLLASGVIKPFGGAHIINEGALVDRVRKAAELVRSGQLKGAKAIIDFTV